MRYDVILLLDSYCAYDELHVFGGQLADINGIQSSNLVISLEMLYSVLLRAVEVMS